MWTLPGREGVLMGHGGLALLPLGTPCGSQHPTCWQLAGALCAHGLQHLCAGATIATASSVSGAING